MKANTNKDSNKVLDDLINRISKENTVTIMSKLATRLLNICNTTEVHNEADVAVTDENGITSKRKMIINIKIKDN